MLLDDHLLRLLACPIDKEALLYFPDDGMLYNPRLRRRYRIEAGIPVLLADQAEAATADFHCALVERAARGDARATLGQDATDLVPGWSIDGTASMIVEADEVGQRS